MDFFGAIRAAAYDDQIRQWIAESIGNKTKQNKTLSKRILFVSEGDLADPETSLVDLTNRLVQKKNLPTFETVQFTLDMLIREGERLAMEQQRVNDIRLSQKYLKGMKGMKGSGSLIGFG